VQNLFALAPPGIGKSMLARGLTIMVPATSLAEAPEATRLYRVAGLTGDRTAAVTTRTCRAPHQTISDAGLSGGGHVPLPGEASRGHYGVRWLDARPECRRHVLEVWRQPLEEGVLYRQSRARPRPRRLGRTRGARQDTPRMAPISLTG
jgi:magnesium chelatase family protein